MEGVIRKFQEIREFQIVLNRVRFIDEITVKVEPLPSFPAEDYPSLAKRVSKGLSIAHEGLRFNVEVVEPGELPTFDLKAKRLIDKRGE